MAAAAPGRAALLSFAFTGIALVPVALAFATLGRRFDEDGGLFGAACWRADGTPIGMSGGLARAGVRFGLR